MVQRTLGAPNETKTRRGSIAAAINKLLPVFIFIIHGVIAFALAKTGQVTLIQSELFSADGELIIENVQKVFAL